MDHGIEIVSSQSFDCLADYLYGSLVDISTPFQRQIVILPHLSLKEELLFYFTEKKGCKGLFGIEFLELSSCMPKLLQKMRRLDGSLPCFSFPSASFLALHIEKELRQSNDPIVKQFLSSSNEKKCVQFSDQLAQLFLRYEKYGGSAKQKWQKQEDWQAELWRNVMKPWHTLDELDTEDLRILPHEKGLTIHLFHCSFISYQLLRFFEIFQKDWRCIFYQFSPSEKYWDDLFSAQKQKFLEGKFLREGVPRSEWQSFVNLGKNQNQLVANNLTLGKHFFRYFEEKECPWTEQYPSLEPNTLLGLVQRDIRLLNTPEEEGKESLASLDHSLTLHGVPTSYREVEVAQMLIMNTLIEYPKMQPRDIAIVVSDLAFYQPWIEMIFKREGLPFQLNEVSLFQESQFLKAFLFFLDLTDSKWEFEEIFKWFHFPVVYEKLGLSYSDVLTIEHWMKKQGVTWGYDTLHRQEILGDKDYQDSYGTWENACEKLLIGLAIAPETSRSFGGEPTPFYHPAIEYSQSEQLGDLIYMIRNMKKDLSSLNFSYTLQEWQQKLLAIIDTYFLLETANQIEQEACHVLKQIILDLGRHAYLTQEYLFSFESVRKAIENVLRKKTISLKGQQNNAVRIYPFSSTIASCDLLLMIGMDEDSLPRKLQESSLDWLKEEDTCDPYPHPTEEDRYFFLQYLLLPKQGLHFIYPMHCEQDGKELGSCCLIEELTAYLDKRWEIKGEPISDLFFTKHPATRFDLQYFMPNSKWKNTSLHDYYCLAKQDTLPFTSRHTISFFEEIVSIHLLEKLAKHPIQFYCNDTLGFYIHDEDLFQIGGEKEFILTPIEKAKMRPHFQKGDQYELYQHMQYKGNVPKGIFETIALEKIEEEQARWQKAYDVFGLNEEEVCSLSFSETRSTITKNDYGIESPAIVIPIEAQRKTLLVGHIADVTSKGLLLYGEDKPNDWMKYWPRILIYSYMASSYPDLFAPWILFIKDQTKKESVPNAKEQLQKFLEYYFQAKASPSPCLPELAKEIVEENEETFMQKFNRVLVRTYPFEDRYLQWIFKKDPKLQIDALWSSWKEMHPFKEMQKWQSG